MKVIVAGSREGVPQELVWAAIEASPWRTKITRLVCGKARGVDTYGEWWAKEQRRKGVEIEIDSVPADWDAHGKAAGFLRNREMGAHADALILVWDGKSRGSFSMKEIMKGLEKPIFEVVVSFVPGTSGCPEDESASKV